MNRRKDDFHGINDAMLPIRFRHNKYVSFLFWTAVAMFICWLFFG